jgi:hypothetical protein
MAEEDNFLDNKIDPIVMDGYKLLFWVLDVSD